MVLSPLPVVEYRSRVNEMQFCSFNDLPRDLFGVMLQQEIGLRLGSFFPVH